MSLIRAVEKFDFARGNKFSTYASWAIMKNFARTIPEENYRRDRFVTGHEEMFEAAADTRTDEHEYESALEADAGGRQGMLGRLDDRERRIIISRYGLDGAGEQTLEQLGRELGITKERVRQIESRARTSSARSPSRRSSTCRCSERPPDLSPRRCEIERPLVLLRPAADPDSRSKSCLRNSQVNEVLDAFPLAIECPFLAIVPCRFAGDGGTSVYRADRRAPIGLGILLQSFFQTI